MQTLSIFHTIFTVSLPRQKSISYLQICKYTYVHNKSYLFIQIFEFRSRSSITSNYFQELKNRGSSTIIFTFERNVKAPTFCKNKNPGLPPLIITSAAEGIHMFSLY